MITNSRKVTGAWSRKGDRLAVVDPGCLALRRPGPGERSPSLPSRTLLRPGTPQSVSLPWSLDCGLVRGSARGNADRESPKCLTGRLPHRAHGLAPSLSVREQRALRPSRQLDLRREHRRFRAWWFQECDQGGHQIGYHGPTPSSGNRRNPLPRLARPAGLEPATVGLEILAVDFLGSLTYAHVWT